MHQHAPIKRKEKIYDPINQHAPIKLKEKGKSV